MPSNKSSSELAADIEQQRNRIDERLDSLRQNLSFGGVAGELGDRTGFSESAVADRARANPGALALAGAGIAWFLLNDRRTKSDKRLASNPESNRKNGDSAMTDYHDTVRTDHRPGPFGASYDRDPLIIGVFALAAGAVLGTLLPSTRRENRMMGELHDEASSKLRSKVGAARRNVEDAASNVARKAQEALDEELSDTSEFERDSSSDPVVRPSPGSAGKPQGDTFGTKASTSDRL